MARWGFFASEFRGRGRRDGEPKVRGLVFSYHIFRLLIPRFNGAREYDVIDQLKNCTVAPASSARSLFTCCAGIAGQDGNLFHGATSRGKIARREEVTVPKCCCLLFACRGPHASPRPGIICFPPLPFHYDRGIFNLAHLSTFITFYRYSFEHVRFLSPESSPQ